jgi:glutamate racemase
MIDTRYNGWSNWETWVTNLWLSEMFYDHQVEAQHDSAEELEECLRDATWEVIGCTHHNQFLSEIVSGFMTSVDFREIAEHVFEDVEREDDDE